MVKITIFGVGYVGLVTGVCLSEIGYQIKCIDIDKSKIDLLNNGKAPFYEPHLSKLLTKSINEKHIEFTTDVISALEQSEYIIIAVGTPPNSNGDLELKYIHDVANAIGNYLNHNAIIIIKSTVPIGTNEEVRRVIDGKLKHRALNIEFSVVSNPEFLRQGNAINDFKYGPRIIIGAVGQAAVEKMRILYQPFIDKGQKFLTMDPRSAELTKYACNTFLANKISMINEIANIAELVGADIDKIKIGVGSDPRIGSSFLNAGCGYGGSCLPKDVHSLLNLARENGYNARMLSAIDEVNKAQPILLYNKIIQHVNNLKDKTFALWGLSFKPDTDDLREAPSLVLIDKLLQNGAKIRAYDPAVMNKIYTIYNKNDNFIVCDSAMNALDNVDALVIITEWEEFKKFDTTIFVEKLRERKIFDGRNLYKTSHMLNLDLYYYCIGKS